MEIALPSHPSAAVARQTRVLSGITGFVTTVVVGAALSITGVLVPAQQAAADTGVTITAKSQDREIASAPFPELAVTVSQTNNLVSQGIEIEWTGGKKSTLPNNQTGGENFLQIAQCWGNDPLNASQPDRTTCQYGAFRTPGATRDGSRPFDLTAKSDLAYTDPGSGYFEPAYTSIPFKSVAGEMIENVKEGKKIVDPATGKPVEVDVNTNRFFTEYTSNEIPWAGSGEDGTGSTKFEVQTAVQSSGLGCGTPVTGSTGAVTGSSCWLVIIPRGTADAGQSNITQSGLFEDAWKHKLAVKLDFRPIGVRCAIGAAERQISGSELVAGAVSSWQPELCNSTGGAVYTMATGNQADAATAANGTIEAPMALTSRPLGGEGTDALAYAPIALSGLSVSFAIDREPRAADDTPADALARARLPFTSLNLTPRLLAKLMTNSYLDSLPYRADRKHLGYLSNAERGSNARNLTYDPDFLAVNDPEWAYQALVSPSLADLLLPQGRSDEAWTLWNYIVADPEAAAFLAGKPDPWGMIVNPWSSTSPENLSGNPLTLPRDNFPKADPVEQPADGEVGAVNLVTWRPYTNDFDTSAYLTLRGDGQVLGGWDPTSAPAKYTKSTRSLAGLQRVLGLTDTASAAKYQVISAALLNPAGSFVAPTTESLTAAAAAMTAAANQPQVYGFDPTSETARGASTAYPLAMPVYAAVNPGMAAEAARADYATFIRFASSTGQEPGAAVGDLPEGYAPIPQGWRDQALAAANLIQSGPKKPVAPAAAAAPASAAATPAASGSSAPRTATQAAAAAPSVPTASGEIATALAGKATPDDPKVSAVQSAVPLSLLAGVLSALLVPVLSRIRRRIT
jgi:hypothetical protein